jgi:hypothetical protein
MPMFKVRVVGVAIARQQTVCIFVVEAKNKQLVEAELLKAIPDALRLGVGGSIEKIEQVKAMHVAVFKREVPRVAPDLRRLK